MLETLRPLQQLGRAQQCRGENPLLRRLQTGSPAVACARAERGGGAVGRAHTHTVSTFAAPRRVGRSMYSRTRDPGLRRRQAPTHLEHDAGLRHGK